MWTPLILAAITTASLTQTILYSSLFAPVRQGLATAIQTPQRKPWQRLLLGLPLCQYCLGHWLGLFTVLAFDLSWMTLFPVIWLANCAIIASNALANLPPLMQAVGQTRHQPGVGQKVA